MKQTAVILLALVALVACVTHGPSDYERWAALPTPLSWAPGSKWTFVVFDKHQKLIQSMTVVLTETKGESCTSGDWRHVEVLSKQPPSHPQFHGVASYLLEGSAFTMNLTANLCNSGQNLSGKLTETGIIGAYYSGNNLSGENLGHFLGVQAADVAAPDQHAQPISPKDGTPVER